MPLDTPENCHVLIFGKNAQEVNLPAKVELLFNFDAKIAFLKEFLEKFVSCVIYLLRLFYHERPTELQNYLPEMSFLAHPKGISQVW